MLCTSKGIFGSTDQTAKFLNSFVITRAVIPYTCTLVYIQLEEKGNKLPIVDPSIGKYEIYIATLFW